LSAYPFLGGGAPRDTSRLSFCQQEAVVRACGTTKAKQKPAAPPRAGNDLCSTLAARGVQILLLLFLIFDSSQDVTLPLRFLCIAFVFSHFCQELTKLLRSNYFI
jgi:hypothetical protein